MSNSGFSYTGRHSYSSAQSYAGAYSYMGAAGSAGYDGQFGGNPLLTQGLQSTREDLLGCLSGEERAAAGELLQQPIWKDPAPDGLPQPETVTRLTRHGREVRAALYQFELLSHVQFKLGSGAGLRYAELHVETGKGRAKLMSVTRPTRPYFEQHLRRVQAMAPLRESRMAEILTQVTPPMAYFASLLNLQEGRHAKTLELLQTALQFSYAVCMRFKHGLAVPRPSEHSSQVQPMLEVPLHPAYPAGHSLEAHVSATLLGALAKAPALQQRLLRRLATRIAENRVVAGLHFPIDCTAGRLMGDALASYFLAICRPDSGWRGGCFDGAALDPATAGEQEFSARLEAFEDDADNAMGLAGGGPQLPLLQKLWSLAEAEWN